MRETLGLPWFGPKRHFGWGWTPIRWQGWALTLASVVVILGLAAWNPGGWGGVATVLGALFFSALVALTGTRPGGRFRL